MDCQMIYLRYLATLLTNGALMIRMLPVMPRASTINYVTPLPVTLTTAHTGGKGSLTWQVHCEFMVGSETIYPHFTK